MAVHSSSVFKQLRRIVNLPEDCTRAVLTLEFDAAAVVDCTYYPAIDEHGPVTKRYRLVEDGPNAKIRLSPDVVVSDQFRTEFNQWLLDTFGEAEVT